MLNLDQFSDASDSDDDDEVHLRKKECPAPPPRSADPPAPAEPAAEPSPMWKPCQEAELKQSGSPPAAKEACDRSTDDSATEADSSESAELCSLSAGEPEPEAAGGPDVAEALGPEPACGAPPIAVSEMLRLRLVATGEPALGKSHIPGALVAAAPPANYCEPASPPRSPPQQPPRGGAGRRGGAAAHRHRKPAPEPRWRPEGRPEGRAHLAVSDNSWAAQQKARRGEAPDGDPAEVERKLKSILNKLTLTNFDSLCQQLLDCGVWAAPHLELLIGELFEKATTQHHFIDMYADLCVVLHDHFTASPPTGANERFSFKRLLLNACQASFERHLAPPEGLDQLDCEERTTAEVRYKTKMLGNIRFVGALLVRQILASKVLLAIIAELLSGPTREALEALAALLAVVGPTFDTDEWAHRDKLDAVFEEMKAIASRPSCEKRSCCLLKDVLDMRKRGWKDMRPKTREAPAPRREALECKPSEKPAAAPARRQAAPPPRPTGSPAAFRAELSRALAELRCSGDGQEVAARIAQQPAPPAASQPEEFCNMLALVCQESRDDCRKAGFRAAAGLFLDCGWQPAAAHRGFRAFAEHCEDLRYDIPTLPSILEEELRPALLPLLRKGLLDEGALAALPGR